MCMDRYDAYHILLAKIATQQRLGNGCLLCTPRIDCVVPLLTTKSTWLSNGVSYQIMQFAKEAGHTSCCDTARLTGRAPNTGSKPCRAT